MSLPFVTGQIPQAADFNDLATKENLSQAVIDASDQLSGYTQSAQASADLAAQNSQIAQSAANNAGTASNIYLTVSAAQVAITAGTIPNNGLFGVNSSLPNNYIDQYQNVSGTATATGKSYPSSTYVASLASQTTALNNVVNVAGAGHLTGWQMLLTDITGNAGLLGVDDGGGVFIPGVNGNVQSYLSCLYSNSLSATVSGYHYVFLTGDGKTAVAAIDSNGYLWLAGMASSVQTTIANIISGASTSLLRPDGTGKNALYSSQLSTTPLWSYFPVVSAQNVTTTGISFTYNMAGTLKTALIPTIAVNNSESIREINSTSLTMDFFAGRGQSLRVGAYGSTISPIASMIGNCLMFSGAGKDRGASIDGPVTDATLGALCDGYIIANRNNCQIPAVVTILSKNQSRGTTLPIIVSRMDAHASYAYNSLAKGTQVYIDGITAFTSFCSRATSIGKLPICKLIGFTHGEADSNVTGLASGTYLGYLTQWANDTQSDMMAISGQTYLPWLDVDQLGSLTNTSVISGVTQSGYTVAIDQWMFTKTRAEAFMSVPKWYLNRLYPYDQLHLINLGYLILGEYQGLAEDWTIYNRTDNPSGTKFTPVQPVSISKTNATTFNITFSSPYGLPLQIKSVGGLMAPNLGCKLLNGSANIVSASQTSNFVFTFVTDVAPTVGDYFSFGCNSTDNGVNSYPMINIFDTSTTVSRYDPTFTMLNPCVVSQIAVI
jgi:hypothetical protein